MLVLLGAGANPSATNSCGFSPGSCFLRPLGSKTRAGVGTSLAATADFFDMRQALREHRGRLGHVRRLADATAKRLVVAAVVDRAMVSVHRFVEFALEVCFFVLGPSELVAACRSCMHRARMSMHQAGEDVPVGYSSIQVGEPDARRCRLCCK